MTPRNWFLILAGVLLIGSSAALASDKRSAEEIRFFGLLQATEETVARSQALAWLKQTGRTDAAALQSFAIIWDQPDRPLLDRLAETFALGHVEAARLLAAAHDPLAAAPKEAPALLKDATSPAFFRANLALAYAKALSNRRVYEEALDVLQTVKPEQVVDPAAYFFHKAVAEHALMRKAEARKTITRLLEDVVDAPDRYRLTAVLMLADLQSWQDKGLGAIARKMDNVERRLDLSRAGPETQKLQRKIVHELDELIKQLENPGGCPNCPAPAQAGAPIPPPDTPSGDVSGPGKVDDKQFGRWTGDWGKLPEKERARAMMELSRQFPGRYREVIENYHKRMAQTQP